MFANRRVWGWVLSACLAPGAAQAAAHHLGGHGHHHHGGGGVGGGGGGFYLGGAGGGYGYGFGFGMTIGPNGPLLLAPPWTAFSPWMMPAVAMNRGPLAGPMPAFIPQQPVPQQPAARAKRADPNKGGQLVTIGDRLFRAGNVKRAAERYEQAARAAPGSAAPQVRLAQIALVRGQFAEAAEHFRKAVTAEPGWLINAPDVESLYAEPADFARQVARLESRVHRAPGDRDAWFVLGAELYLSGQTRRAADIFLRLTDRKPDPTLAAFLDASTPAEKAGD